MASDYFFRSRRLCTNVQTLWHLYSDLKMLHLYDFYDPQSGSTEDYTAPWTNPRPKIWSLWIFGRSTHHSASQCFPNGPCVRLQNQAWVKDPPKMQMRQKNGFFCYRPWKLISNDFRPTLCRTFMKWLLVEQEWLASQVSVKVIKILNPFPTTNLSKPEFSSHPSTKRRITTGWTQRQLWSSIWFLAGQPLKRFAELQNHVTLLILKTGWYIGLVEEDASVKTLRKSVTRENRAAAEAMN